MLKEFTIGFSRTINLGNFQSARVEASATYSLDEVGAENFEKVLAGAQIDLRHILEETYRAQHKSRQEVNGTAA